MSPDLTLDDIHRARSTIAHLVHETPVLSTQSLGRLAGCQLFLKAENLQRAGSFKIRGAVNKIAHLSPAMRAKGVVAASAGNHAQGVALAARNFDIPCTIVMPAAASIPKVEATKGYGATVVLQGKNYEQAQRHAQRIMREQDLTFVHGFDDPEIIAGQGTIGLELLRQMEDVDTVVVPVGGGGLIGGIALAIKETRPLAAVLSGRVQVAGKKVAVILSGGNVDPNLVARVLVPLGHVEVQLTLETRDWTHAEEVRERLLEAGYALKEDDSAGLPHA